MKYTLFAFVALLIASPSFAGTQAVAPPEWYQCKKDSDCMFVPGVCTENTVINRQYEKPYGQMMKQVKMQCPKTEARYPNATPSCVDNHCVMNVPDEFMDKRNKELLEKGE